MIVQLGLQIQARCVTLVEPTIGLVDYLIQTFQIAFILEEIAIPYHDELIKLKDIKAKDFPDNGNPNETSPGLYQSVGFKKITFRS